MPETVDYIKAYCQCYTCQQKFFVMPAGYGVVVQSVSDARERMFVTPDENNNQVVAECFYCRGNLVMIHKLVVQVDNGSVLALDADVSHSYSDN